MSPAERAVSRPPWKAMRVLCARTPSLRSSAFCVSKSTSNTVIAAKRGSASSAATIGFCAWQVEHQGAVTCTTTGRPSACAAAIAAGE